MFLTDLHYSYPSFYKEKALKENNQDVDALILCGDNAEIDPSSGNHKYLFSLLKKNYACPIGFVVGNHELFGDKMSPNIPTEKIMALLANYESLAKEFEMIYLEKENLSFKEAVIAGTYGHYDGSLIPEKTKGYFNQDKKTVKTLITNLEDRVNSTNKQLIIIGHTVPDKSLIGRPNSLQQDKFTPYAGSTQLKKMMKKLNPIIYICGHTHAIAQEMIENTLCLNIGTDYNTFKAVVYDTKEKLLSMKDERVF